MKRIREILSSDDVRAVAYGMVCVFALFVVLPLSIQLFARAQPAHAGSVDAWLPWAIYIGGEFDEENYCQSEPSVTPYGNDWLHVVYIDESGMRNEVYTHETVIKRQEPEQAES